MRNNLQRFRRWLVHHVLLRKALLAVFLVPFGLSGCGGSNPAVTTDLPDTTAAPLMSGMLSDPAVTTEPGPSPFISWASLSGHELSSVTAVTYTIVAKPGSVSSPVRVEYSTAALKARGYLSGGTLTIPVFGLYAGYENRVLMELTRQRAAPIQLEADIPTAAYSDDIYSQPDVVVPRPAGSSLGFNFIYVKSALGSPVIVDTDGEVRWAAPGVSNSTSSAFVGDSFIIGDASDLNVYRLGLDGSLSQASLAPGPLAYTFFHHDIDYGKLGLLAELNAWSNGLPDIESNIIEMRDDGAVTVQNLWDLGAIIGNYMSSQGDDAAAFVRPGVDWFHSNSAIYDPRDDSIIVSSRENFVMKLDYSTGAIKWILGDPTKYWYTFPSLRAKALTLAPGGLYPIGQHGLSITPDGLLMLFNDGLGSMNQPAGEPAGQTRTYSAVSAYVIDATSMTAREVWRYDAGQTIYSSICSSAYESPDGSVLVDYATADNATEALLVGLAPDQKLAFEFAYPTSECDTSWNARPIGLEDLRVLR